MQTEFNKGIVPMCVYQTLHVCMLTVSSTEHHCVSTCRPCRGRTLGGMGSWPWVHLLFNEQMAAQILWPLNKAANSPSQLIKGALHCVTADLEGIYSYRFTVSPPLSKNVQPCMWPLSPKPKFPIPQSSQPALLPCLSLSAPASNRGSPPLCSVRRTERLIVWKLHRQCFYWRSALPLTPAAWA